MRSFNYYSNLIPMKIKLNLALFIIGLVFIAGFILGIYARITITCS